ncbi:MAG: exosortase/archaeosortase family protein [Planctomycetota bacterium]
MPTTLVVGWVIAGAIFFAVFYSAFVRLVGVWSSEEDYQHGFFVPVFSAFLLWHRRAMLADGFDEGGYIWALPCFAISGLLRGASVWFNVQVFDEYAIIPALAGLAFFMGGWGGIRWAWPAVAFLFFMVPLPHGVSDVLAQQLRSIAAVLSTFVIQTLGIPAVRHGNVIHLTQVPLEVEDACSGLRMLMLFFAICIGGAFVHRGPLWEKIVLVASAIPIAIIANVVRISVTAIQREYYPNEWLDKVMHDWAGLAMPLIALGLLWLEYTLLQRLFPSIPEDRPITFTESARA